MTMTYPTRVQASHWTYLFPIPALAELNRTLEAMRTELNPIPGNGDLGAHHDFDAVFHAMCLVLERLGVLLSGGFND